MIRLVHKSNFLD